MPRSDSIGEGSSRFPDRIIRLVDFDAKAEEPKHRQHVSQRFLERIPSTPALGFDIPVSLKGFQAQRGRHLLPAPAGDDVAVTP